jgi:hypothetical protein
MIFPFLKHMTPLPPGLSNDRIQVAVEHCAGSMRTNILSQDPLEITFEMGFFYKVSIEDKNLRLSPWLPTWSIVVIWAMIFILTIPTAGLLLGFVLFFLAFQWVILKRMIGPKLEKALLEYIDKSP